MNKQDPERNVLVPFLVPFPILPPSFAEFHPVHFCIHLLTDRQIKKKKKKYLLGRNEFINSHLSSSSNIKMFSKECFCRVIGVKLISESEMLLWHDLDSAADGEISWNHRAAKSPWHAFCYFQHSPFRSLGFSLQLRHHPDDSKPLLGSRWWPPLILSFGSFVPPVTHLMLESRNFTPIFSN